MTPEEAGNHSTGLEKALGELRKDSGQLDDIDAFTRQLTADLYTPEGELREIHFFQRVRDILRTLLTRIRG